MPYKHLFIVGLMLVAMPASAEVVQYTGSLMIGFGDSDNPTDIRNNAVPMCAHSGSNPFAAQTFGTLPLFGIAEQTVAGGLTFLGHGLGGGPQVGSQNGGSEIKSEATCTITVPPFLAPRLRSRTHQGAGRWPSLLGTFDSNGGASQPISQPTPATPTATPSYRVGPGSGYSFLGTQWSTPIPFYNGSDGRVAVTKGANNFGGGVPFQGRGGIQLGLQSSSSVVTPPPPEFGITQYINGFIPIGPQYMGTGAVGVHNQAPTGSTTTFPHGLLVGHAGTFALRTPGGTTIDQQGAIQTIQGGNTQTQSCPPPTPCPGLWLTSPVHFDGAYFEWTTGRVQHTDMIGDFVTVRTATGFDNTNPTTPTPSGTPARRLQLVSPWSASVKLVGPFGFPLPDLGYGGVAVLTLNLNPVPEVASLAGLLMGSLGLAGIASRRIRRSQP